MAVSRRRSASDAWPAAFVTATLLSAPFPLKTSVRPLVALLGGGEYRISYSTTYFCTSVSPPPCTVTVSGGERSCVERESVAGVNRNVVSEPLVAEWGCGTTGSGTTFVCRKPPTPFDCRTCATTPADGDSESPCASPVRLSTRSFFVESTAKNLTITSCRVSPFDPNATTRSCCTAPAMSRDTSPVTTDGDGKITGVIDEIAGTFDVMSRHAAAIQSAPSAARPLAARRITATAAPARRRASCTPSTPDR